MNKPILGKNKSSENPTVATKLSINLLPAELLLQRRQGKKITLINRLCLALLVILVIVSSTTIALKLNQRLSLKESQQTLQAFQDKITQQKDAEYQTLILKNRLTQINQLMGKDSKRKAMFNLVVGVIPQDMQVSEVSIDKNSNMNITLASKSLASIDTLISSLTSLENSDLIKKIDLGGLSLNKDGFYRFDIRITAG